jgi:hypothetical protein
MPCLSYFVNSEMWPSFCVLCTTRMCNYLENTFLIQLQSSVGCQLTDFELDLVFLPESLLYICNKYSIFVDICV